MKRLSVLIVAIILAGALLAATPRGKLLRLEVKNKTDYPVYIKLEGKYTDAFYYLTIPENKDKRFTIVNDIYKRTTWACDGIKSTGELVMTSRVRLVFTPCYRIPLRKVGRWYRWDFDQDGTWDKVEFEIYAMPNFGEPTMEKVWYWKEFSTVQWKKIADPYVAEGIAGEIIGVWDFMWSPDGIHWFWGGNWDGHYSLWIPMKLSVSNRTYKSPLGVWWRYRY